MKSEIYNKLLEYGKGKSYPFHMPGHKRNIEGESLDNLYACDITEIAGFDNLHDPQSIILEAEKRAAKLYGSEESYFMINGSTAGILSAISTVAGNAKKLIIARNCHKAVYNAAFLNHLELLYVYPEIIEDYDISGKVNVLDIKLVIDSVLHKSKIEKAEASSEVAAVVITSPTYDGITSDVKQIADLVHEYGIPLIVDQAHGAHFGLHSEFPENAVREGADIVIHSVHKTLPALTQTALIHKNGSLIDGEVLKKYLSIYQSSSPSYLLMGSIDEAIAIAVEEGQDRLKLLLHYRKELSDQVKQCRFIRICPYTEPGKLVISTKGSCMTGLELHRILREEYDLEMEMSSLNYVTAILTMMDTKAGLQRLTRALLEIDKQLSKDETDTGNITLIDKMQTKVPIWKAYLAPSDKIELQEACGRISSTFVNLYPPGIPLVVPGESISFEIVQLIENYQINGFDIQGIERNEIEVLKSLS